MAQDPRALLAGVRLAEYTPRDPSASVLYTVVRDHFETFRAESARLRDGDGLPRLVEDEFRAFLRCGFLAGGFAITNYSTIHSGHRHG